MVSAAGSVTGSVSRPLSLVSNAESVLQARDSNAKTYMVTMSARMLSNVQVHLGNTSVIIFSYKELNIGTNKS